MRQYMPFYLWTIIIAMITFFLGMRVGTEREIAISWSCRVMMDCHNGLWSWLMFNWFHG